ncbi:AaceriAEL289WAp [[Ashbya] aceris (nom. inval.)]|nr:AaceriAEL289WAp [[Ashbya] aceris (nom. inval.)]
MYVLMLLVILAASRQVFGQLVDVLDDCPLVYNKLLKLQPRIDGCARGLEECLLSRITGNNRLCATCLGILEGEEKEARCECFQCLIDNFVYGCIRQPCMREAVGARKGSEAPASRLQPQRLLPRALLADEKLHRQVRSDEYRSIVNALLDALISNRGQGSSRTDNRVQGVASSALDGAHCPGNSSNACDGRPSNQSAPGRAATAAGAVSTAYVSRSPSSKGGHAFIVSVAAATLAVFSIFGFSGANSFLRRTTQPHEAPASASSGALTLFGDVDLDYLGDSDIEGDQLEALSVPIPLSGQSSVDMFDALNEARIF